MDCEVVTNIKIISDTHFNDQRMISLLGRKHLDVDDMNDEIIKCWNDSVKDDDVVIHLGDIFLDCSITKQFDIIKQLKGIKVLVKGNWDHLREDEYLDMGFVRVYSKPVQIGNYIFSHEPISMKYLKLSNEFVNYHGHSHKYQYGGRYVNCNIDIMGYKPREVTLWDVRKEMII